MLADEELVLPNGPLHPLPNGPPRWMGPNPADPPSVGQPPQANVEHSGVDGGRNSDAAMDNPAEGNEGASETTLDADPITACNQVLKLVAAEAAEEQTTQPTPASTEPAMAFVQLGRVVFGPALPPQGIKLVPYEDSDDEEDFELKEIEGPTSSATPKKRRARKMKEPLEEGFVRRSRRLNPEIGGFRDAASAQAAQDYPVIYAKPLVVVPPEQASVAPYLPVDCIQNIGVGFLQMQPSVVSAAALFDLDDE
ncbi:unnamed protein product [Urochloa humidicola]